MYQNTSKILVPYVLEKANEWALKERSNFKPYAELIEEYAQTHKLIAGEQTGIDLIIGRGLNKDSYPYLFYCIDAESAGHEIADLLYEKTSYPYIQCLSQLSGAEVKIDIGDRTLVRLIQLNEYKGADLTKIVDPVVHNGWFNRHILCINNSIQLARIYRQLSSPAYIDKWEQLIADEAEIIKIFVASMNIEGSADPENIENSESENPEILVQELESAELENIKNLESTELANPEYDCSEIEGSAELFDSIQSNRVIQINNNFGKLQITNINVTELEDQLKNTIECCFQKTLQYPKIPGDEFLTKYTFYKIENDKKVPFLDLFNIADYDPIPQKNNIVHPLVQMRILIVDIWTIKLIVSIGQLPEKFGNKRIKEMFDIFIKIRNELLDNSPMMDVLDILKNNYTYVGTMEKDQYKKSKIIRRMRETRESYYPYLKDKK